MEAEGTGTAVDVDEGDVLMIGVVRRVIDVEAVALGRRNIGLGTVAGGAAEGLSDVTDSKKKNTRDSMTAI